MIQMLTSTHLYNQDLIVGTSRLIAFSEAVSIQTTFYNGCIYLSCHTFTLSYDMRLDSGRLGAGLEGVSETTLSAVLPVLVERHLKTDGHKYWVK